VYFLCNFALKKIKFGRMFKYQFGTKFTIFSPQIESSKVKAGASSVKKSQEEFINSFLLKNAACKHWDC